MARASSRPVGLDTSLLVSINSGQDPFSCPARGGSHVAIFITNFSLGSAAVSAAYGK